MIQSEFQYNLTRTWAAKFERVESDLDMKEPRTPEEELHLAAVRGQLATFRQEMDEYDLKLAEQIEKIGE